MKNTCLDFKFT